MTRTSLLLLIALQGGCTKPDEAPPPTQRVVLTDAVTWEEVRPAVEALLARIEAIDSDGWPPGTAKRSGLALVRVGPIIDRGCARQADPVGLRNELINALTRQGRIDLVSDGPTAEASSSVNAERTYGKPADAGTAQRRVPVTLALKGELQGTRFSLRLIDLRTDAVLIDATSAIPTGP